MMAIIVTCTCGKKFKVKEELAGKRGKCAACGRVLSVPTLAPSLDQDKASPSALRACPTCQEALPPNAVICLSCGLDLRTGKQLPQVKSSAPAAPAGPSAKAPASPARIWVAMVAGGFCLMGVAAAVTLLSRGREPGISATAPKPNPGTQNASPLANAPPGPITHLPSAKGDIPVANNVGLDSKVAPDLSNNPQALEKLFAKVTAITPDHVTNYEKFLHDPTFFNAMLYQGILPTTDDEVRDAVNLGLDKPAISALIKLIQEKKISTDKADQLICAQAIKALGHFGLGAMEANSLLAELQNYKDNAIGLAANLAVADINGKPPLANTPPRVAVPSNTSRLPAGVVLLSNKFVNETSIRLPLGPFGQQEDTPLFAEPGKRLLWTEFKITRPGLTTIDLTKLSADDGTGGRYPPAGYIIGQSTELDRPRIQYLLRRDGLEGPVIATFSGGGSSTEYATLRINASRDAITVNIKSGEAVVSFVFVVPSNVTDLTIRDFAGGDVALGTPAKVDVPSAKKEAPESKVKSPEGPEKKAKFTQSLIDTIYAETMTEAQVTEILNAPRRLTEAQIVDILKANQVRISPGPPGRRLLLWEDSVGNLILVEFIDGTASTGWSKIYDNR